MDASNETTKCVAGGNSGVTPSYSQERSIVAKPDAPQPPPSQQQQQQQQQPVYESGQDIQADGS